MGQIKNIKLHIVTDIKFIAIMPTLILLDVSLSMARRVERNEDCETRYIDLASKFANNLIDHLATNCPQEYTALVVYSSLYEVLVKYTKDFESLKAACNDIEIYDKTIYERMLLGVESIVMEEWGKTVAQNIILITDGTIGVGEGSLRDLIASSDRKFPYLFSFPCHLSVVCLSPEVENGESRAHFEQLIQLNHNKGEFLAPDTLTELGVTQCCARLTNLHYKRFECMLKCGHMECAVRLSPPPNFHNTYGSSLNVYRHTDDEVDTMQLKLSMEV